MSEDLGTRRHFSEGRRRKCEQRDLGRTCVFFLALGEGTGL